MDQLQYSTLLEVLQAIPDPRHARGLRYPWQLLLTLIALAIASGQQTPHAIAAWVVEHADELRTHLHLSNRTFPAESTFRRTLRAIPASLLEHLIARLSLRLAPPAPPAQGTAPVGQGYAIDGKEVRGAAAFGPPVWLVSLVQHESGVVLAQTAVDQKSNEITAVPRLLAGRNLQDRIITMDALLTQRRVAQQIVEQSGHYLTVVKTNQPELFQAIALLFTRPPWNATERPVQYERYRTANKGHGRLEVRILESSPALKGYLDWPGVEQVMRRTCRRIIRKTGHVSEEITYGITSLPPALAHAQRLEQLWRGHWTIENRVHYVRDVTLGEDAGHAHSGHTPQVLAAFRNLLLNLYRVRGWHNIADAVRHYAASVSRAADLIGLEPGRL